MPSRAAACSALTDVGVHALAGLQHLQQLDLGGCRGISGMGFRMMSGAGLAHPGQAHMGPMAGRSNQTCGTSAPMIQGPGGFDGGASAALPVFPLLQTLILSDCRGLSNTGMAHVCALPALQHLDIGGCTAVGNDGLTGLHGHPTLTSLSLRGHAELSDASMQMIAFMPTLRRLSMRQCGGISDAGLMRLAGVDAVPRLACMELAFNNRLSACGVHAFVATRPYVQVCAPDLRPLPKDSSSRLMHWQQQAALQAAGQPHMHAHAQAGEGGQAAQMAVGA